MFQKMTSIHIYEFIFVLLFLRIKDRIRFLDLVCRNVKHLTHYHSDD